MKYSDRIIGKPAESQTADINELLSDWPRRYYEEADPSVRLKALEAAIAAECDPEKDAHRLKIFHMAPGFGQGKGKTASAD